MFYSKEVFLKGLLGFGAVSAASYGGLSQKERIAGWFSSGDEPAEPPAAEITETSGKLLENVGLECQGLETATADNGVVCSKKAGEGAKNIKVKKEESTPFDLTALSSSNGGKIKAYKEESYDNKFKLVIEDGSITEGTNKLEEFETYKIKEETISSNSGTKQYYLNRKTKASDKIKVLLGLDSCTFPGDAATTCNLTTEQIKKINFEGKEGDVTGTGTLQISIAPAGEAEDFPYGFKFTLTPSSSDITINRGSNESWTLKNGKASEFKIKKSGTSLTLEKAWTLTTLTKKVGLTCTSDSTTPTEDTGVNCTKTGNTNIKVKKDASTSFDLSNLGSAGKIKVYKTSTGEDHNEGFKFVIEENDITDNTNKLEQFETYEIKKDSGEWKLNRKSEAKAGIKKALGLPTDTDCELPTDSSEKTCNLDDAKFKKINFEGKGEVSDTISGNPKLKISKVSGTENGDFGPFGYKFLFESTEDAKISNSITIKKNTNTEFKIKRATGSNSISLEKAWTAKSLGDKVGLICPEDSAENKECTLNDGSININIGGDSNKKFTSLSKKANGGDGGEKKVKFELGQEGHNQGIKFTSENEICLQGGNNGDSEGDKKIEQKGSGDSEITYQILKDSSDSKWYLTKKNGSGS